jgi:hypothetical protein
MAGRFHEGSLLLSELSRQSDGLAALVEWEAALQGALASDTQPPTDADSATLVETASHDAAFVHAILAVALSAARDAVRRRDAAAGTRALDLMEQVLASKQALSTLVCTVRTTSFTAGCNGTDACRLALAVADVAASTAHALGVRAAEGLSRQRVHSAVLQAVCACLVSAGVGASAGRASPAASVSEYVATAAQALDGEQQLASIREWVGVLGTLGHGPALLQTWVMAAREAAGWESAFGFADGPTASLEGAADRGGSGGLDRLTCGLARAAGTAAAGRVLLVALLTREAAVRRPASLQPSVLASTLVEALAGCALDFISATPHAGRLCPEDSSEAAFGRGFVGLTLVTVGPVDSLPPPLIACLQWLMWSQKSSRSWPAYVPRAVLAYVLHPRVSAVQGFIRPEAEAAAMTAEAAALALRHGYTAADGDEYGAFFDEHLPLTFMAEAWASSAFVRSVPTEAAATSSRLLAHAIRIAPSSAFTPTSLLPTALLAGVQDRLDSPDESSRVAGMLVARAVSDRMTPGSPLRFDGAGEGADEAPVTPESDLQSVLAMEGACGPDMSVRQALAALHGCAGATSSAGGTPAAAPIVAETLPVPVVPGSSDEPSVLAIARARIAARAPTSLQQALALLLADAGEGGDPDPEGHFALLSTLPSLIRAAAESDVGQGSLLENALPLLRATLGAVDRYSMPGWEAHRFAGLVALAVTVPPLTLPYLISLASAPGWEAGEGMRLEALDVLVSATRELTGREGAPVAPLPPWLQPDWYPSAVDELGNEFPASERPQPTAAIVPSPGDGPAPSRPDVFSDVLPSWLFAPLLAGVAAGLGAPVPAAAETKGLDSDLATMMSPGGGALSPGASAAPRLLDPSHKLLLAQSIRALAVVLECTGPTCEADALRRMHGGALCLAWTLRGHEDAGVRSACLSALAACIATVAKAGEERALLWPSVLAPLQPAAALEIEGGAPELAPSDGQGSLPAMLTLKPAATQSGRSRGARGTALEGLVSVSSRLSLADGLAAALAVVNDGEQGAGRAARGLLQVVQAEPAGGHAAKYSGGPTAWDDLVDCATWVRGTADTDPSSETRALARSILGNAIFKRLVLGPES